jgi:hypothetical protein
MGIVLFFSTIPCERESARESSWTAIFSSMRRDPLFLFFSS